MVQAPSPLVNPAREAVAHAVGIAFAVSAVAFLAWMLGVDAWLARALYEPDSRWAWFMREWGAWVGGVSAFSGLLVCLWPGLWKRHPLFYRSALVLMLTGLLGAGLVNQVIIKELAERPRPRESVLLDMSQSGGEISGNSMPGGHAGMAGILVAPYFVLRRRKPALANAFLFAGLTSGAVVGVSRMVLGAHFFSDIMVGVGIDLVVAALLAGVFERWKRIPEWSVALLIGVGTFAMVWWNDFGMTLEYVGGEPIRKVELPCVVTATPDAGISAPNVRIVLEGHRAPLSQLALVNDHGTLKLRTWMGLYRGLHCTGMMKIPQDLYE